MRYYNMPAPMVSCPPPPCFTCDSPSPFHRSKAGDQECSLEGRKRWASHPPGKRQTKCLISLAGGVLERAGKKDNWEQEFKPPPPSLPFPPRKRKRLGLDSPCAVFSTGPGGGGGTPVPPPPLLIYHLRPGGGSSGVSR